MCFVAHSFLRVYGQIFSWIRAWSKAFDKVNHNILLQTLRRAGFGGSLLQWFQSYITNRHQRVTVQGCTSTSLPVTSGVPQGSGLGPVLFSLYVIDLPDASKSGHVAMFADDAKLFKNFMSIRENEKLQSNLRHLETWSEESGLKFNETKCKTQCLTRNTSNV